MKKLFAKLLIGIAVPLTIAGCNRSGKEAAAYGRDTILIRQMKFFPDVLYINKWDTVVWINQDLVSHDVTAFPGREWTSDTIPPEGSWYKVIGANTGYFCSIHPAMKGKIAIRE